MSRRPTASDPRARCGRARPRQRGAALLTALLIAALASVMVSAMMWRQWQAIGSEESARTAAQARWLLRGAVDWARLILRESRRNSPGVDDLGQPWAVPLADAQLSSFLSAGEHSPLTADAWLAGRIDDAQGRFNLADLGGAGATPNPAALAALRRLCAGLGLDPRLADDAAAALTRLDAAGLPARRAADLSRASPALAAALPVLGPHVVLLPQATPVNANTADAAVLAAVLGIAPDQAADLVSARARAPFLSLADIRRLAPGTTAAADQVDVRSDFFDVTARVRIGDVVVATRALIQRSSGVTRIVRMQSVPPWSIAAPDGA